MSWHNPNTDLLMELQSHRKGMEEGHISNPYPLWLSMEQTKQLEKMVEEWLIKHDPVYSTDYKARGV